MPGSIRNPKPMASVRRDSNHRIDDVAIACDLFRLERLDKPGPGELIWVALEKDGRRIDFHLESDTAIRITTLRDDLTGHIRERRKR
jgi:hypothetical protein